MILIILSYVYLTSLLCNCFGPITIVIIRILQSYFTITVPACIIFIQILVENLAKLKEDDLNKKTALVKHCFNCEHRIDFGNFEILDYNIDYDKRKFLESLYKVSRKFPIDF